MNTIFSRLAALAFAVLTVETSLLAQAGGDADARPTWSLDVDFAFVSVYGTELDVGTITTSGGVNRYDEVVFDADIAARVHFQGRKSNRWGFGIAAFYYDGADGHLFDEETAVEASPVDLVLVETAALGPSFSAPPPSGKLSLSAETHFKTWTLDLEAVRWLVGTEQAELGLLLGVRTAYLFDKREEWLRATGFRYHMGETESETLVGPAIGVGGARRWGRSGLAGLVRLAYLRGSFDLAALSVGFHQMADPERVDVESVVDEVSNAEVRLAYTYRFSERVTAGLGVYAQLFRDAPLAPIGGDLNGPLVTRSGDISVWGLLGTVSIGGRAR